jgi:hypothetical protein
VLQAAWRASKDSRTLGLFLFLRFFLPYLTHPLRIPEKDRPVKTRRLLAFGRRLGQVVSQQQELCKDSLLEDLCFQMCEQGFYAPVLTALVAPVPNEMTQSSFNHSCKLVRPEEENPQV